MWQQLLLQDIPRIPHTLLLIDTLRRATTTNEIQGDFTVLNDEGLFKTRPKHVQHLHVVSIVANVVKNVLIWNYTQCSEYYGDRDRSEERRVGKECRSWRWGD